MSHPSAAALCPHNPYRWNFSATDRLVRWAYAKVAHTPGKAAFLGKAVGGVVVPVFLLIDTATNFVKDALTALKDGLVGLYHLRGRIKAGTLREGLREGYREHFRFTAHCLKALRLTLKGTAIRDPANYANQLPSAYEAYGDLLLNTLYKESAWDKALPIYQALTALSRLPADSHLLYEALTGMLGLAKEEPHIRWLADNCKLPDTELATPFFLCDLIDQLQKTQVGSDAVAEVVATRLSPTAWQALIAALADGTEESASIADFLQRYLPDHIQGKNATLATCQTLLAQSQFVKELKMLTKLTHHADVAFQALLNKVPTATPKVSERFSILILVGLFELSQKGVVTPLTELFAARDCLIIKRSQAAEFVEACEWPENLEALKQKLKGLQTFLKTYCPEMQASIEAELMEQADQAKDRRSPFVIAVAQFFNR